MKRLSHIASDGRVRMVDVSAKPQSLRIAIATGKIKIKRATANAISRNRIGKGNVFATAQIAGIQAAKRAAELIPLCHPLPLSNVEIDFEMKRGTVSATCTARTTAQTGVDIEDAKDIPHMEFPIHCIVSPRGLPSHFMNLA